MNTGSFATRFILLLGLMLVLSVIDLCLNKGKATRYREYGFILVTGALGAAIGWGNDLITSSISPDYFVLGKGLTEGATLRMEACLYGMQVGFSAGVIGGAISLFAARRKSAHPPAAYATLFRLLWLPVIGAILFGFLFPILFSGFDPARFAAQLDGVIDSGRISQFLRVWWIHVGLYSGLAVGLLITVSRILAARKKSVAV